MWRRASPQKQDTTKPPTSSRSSLPLVAFCLSCTHTHPLAHSHVMLLFSCLLLSIACSVHCRSLDDEASVRRIETNSLIEDNALLRLAQQLVINTWSSSPYNNASTKTNHNSLGPADDPELDMTTVSSPDEALRPLLFLS